MASIIPVAKSVTLCELHVEHSDGQLDLQGLFDTIRPRSGFPHTRERFCFFTQLTNGLGRVPCFIDIRLAATDELVWSTDVRELTFPDRNSVIRLARTIEGCVFPEPGLYLLELFCNNTWVCDARLMLKQGRRDK